MENPLIKWVFFFHSIYKKIIMNFKFKIMGNKKIKKTKEETKEVVEQEVHIEEITATISEEDVKSLEESHDIVVEEEIKEIISEETQTPEEEIVPEETPEEDTDEVDEEDTDEIEEVAPRTVQSLSKNEFRVFQRTGIMPK